MCKLTGQWRRIELPLKLAQGHLPRREGRAGSGRRRREERGAGEAGPKRRSADGLRPFQIGMVGRFMVVHVVRGPCGVLISEISARALEREIGYSGGGRSLRYSESKPNEEIVVSSVISDKQVNEHRNPAKPRLTHSDCLVALGPSCILKIDVTHIRQDQQKPSKDIPYRMQLWKALTIA
ncbi:hypothetical protein PENSPDRAFT_672204 [Peniophora sp. CONT]|nr:hypothetical protein PENSPDRAFT_672204 [Peniophora sp. CONT]